MYKMSVHYNLCLVVAMQLVNDLSTQAEMSA